MYISKQGDICYMDFIPTKGYEQIGLRPAVVVSKEKFNKFTDWVIICPITTNTKNFPTHYKFQKNRKS